MPPWPSSTSSCRERDPRGSNTRPGRYSSISASRSTTSSTSVEIRSTRRWRGRPTTGRTVPRRPAPARGRRASRSSARTAMPFARSPKIRRSISSPGFRMATARRTYVSCSLHRIISPITSDSSSPFASCWAHGTPRSSILIIDARRRAFLTAEWRYLVMLNYDVDPAILHALVPKHTELDLWNGRAIASVVGFRFLGTRLLGVPIPLHRNFEEVNLRFYVRHRTADGEVRRGVVFVRELVPRFAIALTARLAYNEPYLAVSMRSTAPAGPVEAPGLVSYGWKMGSRWQGLSAAAVGEATMP